MKRFLSMFLCIAMIIALVPAMSLTASAASANVYVGEEANLSVGPSNSYDRAHNNYTLSDPSLGEIIGRNTIKFLKPGTLTVTNNWQLWDGENPIPETGTYRDTFEISLPTQIQETTIKLDSGDFLGGGIFPEFTVPNNANYYVEEATFYKEMADYYVGDRLPSYKAGTVVNYVSVTLKPKSGYIFAFDGAEDEKLYMNEKYVVEYKGKKYETSVKRSLSDNKLHVYLDVTFTEGEVFNITIKDLDVPYHYGPLDKTATVPDSLQLVSIKYTMFGKELSSFAKGDNIGITVRVKTKDNINKLNPNGKAYWSEQKIYSTETKLISSNEAEYTFGYKVDALDEQYIKKVRLSLPAYAVGDKPTNIAYCSTEGISIKEVKWNETFDTFEQGKSYGLTIEFAKDREYVYAEDFDVFVGNRTVSFNKKDSGNNRFESANYIASTTVTPVTVVDANTGTTTGTMTETTTGTTTGTVTGTVTGTTTDTTVTDKVENTDKTANKDKAENTEKSEKDNPSNSNAGIGNGSGNAYRFPFTDVAEKQWYHESVKQAHKLGLINGKTATLYKPDDNMTFAEAVKLAVCMNILYNGGDPNKDITNGKDVWYSTYMTYALDNGIIDDDLTPKANEKITRKEYVYIFSKALPEKAFAKKNNIPSGSIPDVKEEKLAQDKAIYLFYRAGVLTGNDSKGTFNPSGNITRAEVAAILIRMMDSSARVGAPKDLGK